MKIDITHNIHTLCYCCLECIHLQILTLSIYVIAFLSGSLPQNFWLVFMFSHATHASLESEVLYSCNIAMAWQNIHFIKRDGCVCVIQANEESYEFIWIVYLPFRISYTTYSHHFVHINLFATSCLMMMIQLRISLPPPRSAYLLIPFISFNERYDIMRAIYLRKHVPSNERAIRNIEEFFFR